MLQSCVEFMGIELLESSFCLAFDGQIDVLEFLHKAEKYI